VHSPQAGPPKTPKRWVAPRVALPTTGSCLHIAGGYNGPHRVSVGCTGVTSGKGGGGVPNHGLQPRVCTVNKLHHPQVIFAC